MQKKFARAYMEIAHTFANLSYAKKLKVGCIIVKDRRIISTGYNGMPSGWTNNCEEPIYEEGEYDANIYYKTKDEVLHAESNALMKVAASNDSSFGADLFCTHTPCIECAKLIVQAGIKHVYIDNRYESSRGSGIEFLRTSRVAVTYMSELDRETFTGV